MADDLGSDSSAYLGFAPIEDLDPEPRARGARSVWLEWILGLLLVAALVGAGGWQWWEQGTRLGYYQAGQRAAAAHDWPAARTAYLAAGTYADADARAAEAAALIAEHARQAQLATAAAQAGDWPPALQAAQQVLRIVPDDPQIAPLARTAAAWTYAGALSGTVALRTKGGPPGLYYYGPDGWRQLAASDSRSRVRGTCPNGDPIYDAPDPNAPPRAPAPPDLTRRGGQNLAGRKILVGTRQGPVRAVLAFDPTQYYRFLCTASGVWGYRFATGPGAPPTATPNTMLSVGYQAFGTGQIIMPSLPGAMWSVVAIAPDGQHLLLVNSTVRQAPLGWYHGLALADPTGRLVQNLPGGEGTVAAADLAPDGRSLLLTTALPGAASIHETVTLAPIAGRSGEVPLASNDLAIGQSSGIFNLPPTFIRSGPRAGQIIITGRGLIPAAGRSRNTQAQDQVRLLDPAHPDQPLVTLAVESQDSGSHFIRQDQATGTILVGWANARRLNAVGSTVALIDPSGYVRQITPPLEPWADLSNAWLRAGYLVYASMSAGAATGEPEYKLRSLSLASVASAVAPAIYTSTVPLRPFAQPTSTSFRLGPGLLAYVSANGDLHARTYDGATDVVLEAGVGALYDLDGDVAPGAQPTVPAFGARSNR